MNRFARTALLAAALLATGALSAIAEDAADRYGSEEALRHYLSGRWLEESGSLAAAASEYDRALSLDPSAPGLLLHASAVAARRGEHARSLELAERALVLAPGEARGAWLQGAALFNLERPEQAMGPLRAAVVAEPDNVEYLRTLAHAAEALDRVPLVDSCYTRLADLDEDDPEIWFQLATTRARMGRYAAADSALTIALADNPGRPGALFLRGFLRERMGHPEQAIDLYRRHLAVHSGDQPTRRRLVGLLADQGRLREALEQARAVTANEPREPSSLQVEAELEFKLGRVESGRRSLAALRALDPEDPELVGRSAEVLVRAERVREATRLVDGWADRHPDNARSLLLRAWIRAATGHADSAAVWAERLVAAQPDSAGPRRLLSRYLREAKRYPEAIEQLRWLRERAPNDAGLLLDLGICREQLGDLQGAIEAGRDALALSPQEPSLQNFLGYLLADHDRDLPEAERLIRSALAQDPDNGAYLDSMGWLQFRQRQFDAARGNLERASRLTDGDPVVHEHLGDLYRELKLFDLAREQYRLSLAREGGNTRVQAKLQAVHP